MSMIVPVQGCLLFFDLAGTLMSREGRPSAHQSQLLVDVGRRAERVVLVTGQSGDDPQVQFLMDCLGSQPEADFVAYTTRGMRRWVRSGDSYSTDDEYLPNARMDTTEADLLIGEIELLLADTDIPCLTGPRWVDECAVRTHVDPSLVERTVEVLRANLADYEVVSEGRTSVFAMHPGFSKRQAVEHELALAEPGIAALYFGNELAEGNDREVLDIPRVRARAIGRCGAPAASHCVSLGDGVSDLYDVLDRSVTKCPVLCLGLGGTKVQLGAITSSGGFISEPEIHWRQMIANVRDAATFTNWLAELVADFLTGHDIDWRDIGVVGVPFPGPERDGHWYSNNLTEDFRDGVRLGDLLARAIQDHAGKRTPAVRVVFDAQCDAGGELYQPLGRLRGHMETAMVLNLATGVAAGFISRGRVLTSAEDFSQEVHPSFDSGMGQLGRHLWWNDHSKQWEYHPAQRGETPTLADSMSRMTDRLGGPALAARLLRQAARMGAVQEMSAALDICPSLQELASDVARRSVAGAAAVMRRQPSMLTRTLMQWVDEAYVGRGTTAAVECAERFVEKIVSDLAGAISAWQLAEVEDTRPWERFAKRIVLTGGTGIHFLASSNGIEDRDLCIRLRTHLNGANIDRSQLTNAVERESHIFLHQALAQT